MDKRKINHLGSTNGHQSCNVYGDDGLSPSLCCTDYKSPIKVLVPEEKSMNKKVIKDNFAEIDKGKYVTTDKEKESVYDLTSAQRSRPLSNKQDNYVLETEPKTINYFKRI